MKKFLLVLFAVLLAAGTAFAQGTTVDFGLAASSSPDTGLGTAVGPMVGVSIDFNTFVSAEFKPHSDRIRFRGDIAYFKWDKEIHGIDVEYRRIPVFLGGRYVYPVNPVLAVFGEAGVEISFDEVEVENSSDNDINSGIAIGGGVIFNVSEKFRISLSGRRHEVTDDYETFTAAFGINF